MTWALQRRVLAGALAVALILGAAAVHADDEADARDAMRRGISAFARGDTSAALAEYETAKRLAPMANAPYRYAAEALASVGRWTDVVANLMEYLAKNPNVSDAEEVRSRITKVKAEHYPARLRVVTNVENARVTVDGEAKGAARTFEVAAGKHRVEAAADGKLPTTKEVVLVGDQDASIDFTLVDAPPIVQPPPLALPNNPPIDTAPLADASPWRTVGWIGVGVGAATLVTTFIVDVAVLGPKISDYRAAAASEDTSARQLHDDATSLRSGLLVSYVVGAVIGVGGTALVLFVPRRVRAAITPTLGPGHAGASARILF